MSGNRAMRIPPDSPQLAPKFRGTLLGALVGDAMGAPFEGHPGPVPPERIGELVDATGTLRYTDDTAMTIGLAESLLHTGRLDPDHLAITFARYWEREPHRGYGGGTASLLARIAAGEPWHPLARGQFDGQGSFGNGAAMRVAPVALQAPGDPGAAASLATVSAQVTHAHPVAVDATRVQAAAVSIALTDPRHQPLDPSPFLTAVRSVARQASLYEQLDLVAALAGSASAREVAARLGTGVAADEAVPAALCAFLRHPDSFADTIRFAISLGGDTDTIASMAGAMAGARLGDDAIPASWVHRIEGADKLRELADRFAAQLRLPARRR